MSEEPTLAERHARIAALEEELRDARARAVHAPKARAGAEARLANVTKQVAALEERLARKAKARRAPVRIKNGTAAATALAGAVVALVGVGLQIRVLATPLVWVKTACTIVDGGDNPDHAAPELRTSASFVTLHLPPPGTTIPCWVPDDPLGDGLGRTRAPAEERLGWTDKLRRLYFALLFGGLGALGLGASMATEPPVKD